MSDLDKLLRDSLRETGDSYRVAGRAEARRAFLERARRRRRMFYGSLAAATACVIAIGFLLFRVSDIERPFDGDVAGPDGVRISAVIDVGRAPDSVTIGKKSVWVVNASSRTVSRVDPVSNEVITGIDLPEGSDPEDVAQVGDSVWVSDASSGSVYRLDIGAGAVIETVAVPGAQGESLDLAAGNDTLWTVSPAAGLNQIDAATGRIANVPLSVSSPTDIAIGAGYLWVLDGSAGTLVQIDTGIGTEIGTIPLDSVSGASGADLAVGGGWVWIADPGSHAVVRVSPQVGEQGSVPMVGSYAGISVGQGGAWVVSGGASGRGSLMLIDVDRAVQVGEPLALGGRPFDVVAGLGAVWVSARDDNALLRIDRPQVAAKESSPGVDAVAGDELVYVYSSGGDILAKLADGTIRSLVTSPDFESNPSFTSDPDVFAFERSASPGEDATFATYDLVTGTEGALDGTGRELALGPEGRAAWVTRSGGRSLIHIESASGSREVPIGNPNLGPVSVANLEWDHGGERLYLEAGYGSRGLYAIEVTSRGGGLEASTPRPLHGAMRGSALLAPSSSEDGVVEVIRLCCRSAGTYQTAELGRLTFDDSGGFAYEKIEGLDDIGFDQNRADLTLEPADTLDVETATGGGPTWTLGDARSWIVGDGRELWLVDEGSETDRLAPSGVTGVAASPRL